VVLCPPETVGSGEVRGGAPGTRETDLLRPGTLVKHVNAVLITGGSAFGLAAADGVMRFLEEQGIGYDTLVARVPIVPAAVLFDLGAGDPSARPGPEQGYAACVDASQEFPEWNVGAGTGATAAKLHGIDRAVKGGLGTASRADGEVVVGALAAVNAYGEVLDDDGSVLAGARESQDEEEGEEATEATENEAVSGPSSGEQPLPGMNTTLVVVATNAGLSKERAHLLALAAHDGIAGTIRPAHTMWDGDTAFTLATGDVEADQRGLESMAEEAVKEAIRRAVLLAHSVPGFPSAKEGRLA
jgi:L-aminopeptidase/D-esterase-like protein